jgi:hypothetical protein
MFAGQLQYSFVLDGCRILLALKNFVKTIHRLHRYIFCVICGWLFS